MNGIKVTVRDTNYIDFEITNDPANLYRYVHGDKTFHKLFGVGRNNFGKAVRGKEREKINEIVKIVFENNLPFAIIA